MTPRAGHAGITIYENWYIVGGGDNRNGMCSDMLAFYSKDAYVPPLFPPVELLFNGTDIVYRLPGNPGA